MSKWEDIYSETGLQEAINESIQKINNLKEKYLLVEQGLLYNPLCKDANMKEILAMIREEEILQEELREALNKKLESY